VSGNVADISQRMVAIDGAGQREAMAIRENMWLINNVWQ
jgi:hypothetical protein